MAMVAAALRHEVKRVITVRPSILHHKCSYTPSIGSLRALKTFNNAIPNSNAYKKLSASSFESRYTSAAKFTTTNGEEAKASNTRKRAGSVKIGDNAVSHWIFKGASHSVINAQTVKELCLETKPTPPTTVTFNPPLPTVTLDRQSYRCDTKCFIEWQMGNQTFTWTFLVMPLSSKWDMVLGADWMEHVTPLNLDLDGRRVTVSTPDGILFWLKDAGRD